MNDLINKRDIETLMNAFYNKALSDPIIAKFFTEVAPIDLKTHLPHICAFWEHTLFYTGTYQKNVLQIHMELHKKETLQKNHFEQWLLLFNETVDEYFTGTNAQKIKTKALSIATVMQMKLHNTK